MTTYINRTLVLPSTSSRQSFSYCWCFTKRKLWFVVVICSLLLLIFASLYRRGNVNFIAYTYKTHNLIIKAIAYLDVYVNSNFLLCVRNDGAECQPKMKVAFMKTHKCATSTIGNIIYR